MFKSWMSAVTLTLFIIGVRVNAGELTSESTLLEASTRNSSAERKSFHNGQWFVLETMNFRIWNRHSGKESAKLGELCEDYRQRLRAAWMGDVSGAPWVPKCNVFVHGNVADYNAALGRVNDRSVGCATYDVEHDRVVRRRIDLRTNSRDWQNAALPHELTHVVMADFFLNRLPPLWVDEGMAVLAESPDKQFRRFQELQRDRQRGLIYSLDGLLTLNSAPAPRMRNAFYGQSAALVSTLVRLGTPEQFILFAKSTQNKRCDQAIRDIYGPKVLQTLQQLWKAETKPTRVTQAVVLNYSFVSSKRRTATHGNTTNWRIVSLWGLDQTGERNPIRTKTPTGSGAP